MSKSEADDRSPNVVVFFTDQQRWDTVGAYGSPMNLTPNLDSMASRGVQVEQSFTCQPVCGPARSCFQTGQYATTTGVWRNGISLPGGDHTLAREFSRNGYDVGYVGKWHLAGTGVDPIPESQRGGYDGFWRAADILEFTSHPYEGLVYDENDDPVLFDGYRVDALTEMATEFVQRDRENPFFLFLSHVEPHHQNDLRTYVAPEGYSERYRNHWVPPDLQNRPGDWQDELPDYYGICRRIDECFGRLLKVLEECGERERTIILFTADHGSHFRTRNEEYKRSCHEASIRVPTVFSGPGFDGRSNINELISLVDLPPTLLEAAGLDVPNTMEGQSAMALLNGGDLDWRSDVFVQISEAELGRALRTDRWKYAVYDPTKDGGKQATTDRYVERYLYDLHADPYERTNLAGRDEYRDIAANLLRRLRERIHDIEEKYVEIDRTPFPP